MSDREEEEPKAVSETADDDTPIELDEEVAPPMMMAEDFRKTLENSSEWQDMEKSLKEALAKFDKNETREVVDIPLIKAEEKIGIELDLPDVPSYYQLGHILQSRLVTMEDEFKCEILNQVQDDIIDWLKNIFRFQAKTVNGFRDPRQPILRAIRCALSVKFGQEKDQRERGFENFLGTNFKKYPIIYLTDDIPETWINYYQTQLNLPKSCFCVHRIRDGLNGDEYPFEINRLYEQVMKDNEDPEKEPVIIIGTAGTESGLDDKIEGLMHICGKYQIWSHIEGDNLPCLGTIGIPKKFAPIMACNSVTFKPSDFCLLGLPNLFCMRSTNQAIRCQPWEDELVPVWVALQLSGAHNIRERILNGLRISNDLVSALSTIPHITCSVKERVGDEDEKDYTSIKDFISDTMKSITEPDQPRLTIIFQWNPEVEYTNNDFTDNLLDSCNYKILCSIQERTDKLECVENMTDEGSCIRVRSLVSALKGAQKEDVDSMRGAIVSVLPEVTLYFEQAYELWVSTESRSELKLELDPNDDLSLGAIAFLPMDAPHDQINEEIFRILTNEIDVGFGFDTETTEAGLVFLKILHIPAEIDIENMVKNICDLGYAAEEQYRRNSELMRRMLEAKERTEQQLDEERQRRIAEGGIIWPVWSWITSGSQPGDATSGRTFSVVSDKIKVIENPTHIASCDTDDESEIDTNLIRSAFAQKIHFKLKNEPKEPLVNNSETNALSELTEEMTEIGQITEEEAEITDDNQEPTTETAVPTVEEIKSNTNDSTSKDEQSENSRGTKEKEEHDTSSQAGDTENPEVSTNIESDSFSQEETTASIEIIAETTIATAES